MKIFDKISGSAKAAAVGVLITSAAGADMYQLSQYTAGITGQVESEFQQQPIEGDEIKNGADLQEAYDAYIKAMEEKKRKALEQQSEPVGVHIVLDSVALISGLVSAGVGFAGVVIDEIEKMRED